MKVRSHLSVLVVDVYVHDGVILVSEQKDISVLLLLLLLFTLRRCQFPLCTASNVRTIDEMERIWTEPIITYSASCLYLEETVKVVSLINLVSQPDLNCLQPDYSRALPLQQPVQRGKFEQIFICQRCKEGLVA